MHSERTLARSCASCEEIMPVYEKICYCGGPVKLVKVDIDLVEHIKLYYHRKWLRSRK